MQIPDTGLDVRPDAPRHTNAGVREAADGGVRGHTDLDAAPRTGPDPRRSTVPDRDVRTAGHVDPAAESPRPAGAPTAPPGLPALPPRLHTVPRAADLPRPAWDRLAGPDGAYLATRWLDVAEDTSGAVMRYLTLTDDEGLAGGLATAVADADAPWLAGRTDTVLRRSAQEGLPGARELAASLPTDLTTALLPGLVCGGRHLGRTTLLDRDGRGGTGERLVSAAEELAEQEGLRSVAFLHVDEHDTSLRGLLTRRGYRFFHSEDYHWLPVPRGGFPEYAAGFSAHRRRRIGAERRAVRDAGVRITTAPLDPADIPRCAELETTLLGKYGMTAWTPERSAAILRRAHAACGPDALAATARLDGDVIGFALILVHRDRWFAHRAGFDYAAQRGLPLYFELLFYHLVEAAARAGAAVIHYGTGSGSAKSSRGCLGSAQYTYLLT
ncbi:GNAT family N-acetyltransferase [Streptomyces sp. NPDC048566]|uniref:GNAT family N-acetyltransferase n=1 Tax=Streptomyces sp. NPDC048566 TaxID=3365569 RepID=UPI00371E619F